MSGLLRDIAVLDALLLHLLPKIHARFAEVDLPLIWIATEPLLTLFSRELKPVESICRLWDFFLIEGVCAPFAVFLAYAELAFERNLLTGAAAEDSLGAFRLLLGDSSAIAGNILQRAAFFLAPRPFGSGLNETLLQSLRKEAAGASQLAAAG
ncbi:TBC1D10C [Symbiodinium sp. CCMP2456]|nr:TBC1D10C [Symbiodinium sp. CCMP2456]